jgi:hypothetical protein
MMDTSELYIKMCDCPEIFNECKFQGGDWFYEDGKSWMVYEFNEKVSLGEHQEYFGGIVFLPRQDQTQEMMFKGKPWGVCSLATGLANFMQGQQRFYKSGRVKKLYPVGSIEQLWLAFYMWENHQKSWNKKGWEVSNTIDAGKK